MTSDASLRAAHLPVLIIGAGPGGLAAAVALKAQGVPFEVVDAGRQVGGIWDIGRAQTPMYETAHFISSRSLSGFRDYPMPASYPDYPSHALIQRYITDYAKHHDLEGHVRFNTRVIEARPIASGGWAVRFEPTTDNESQAVQSEWQGDYAGLIVAAGMAWHRYMPALEGSFDGEIMHSFDYTGPSQLKGRRVLVVGAGNSGVDIASDAARSAAAAFLSVRRGYRFVPKYILGKPADVFARSSPPLPRWLEKRVFAVLLDHLVVGDLTRFGLPRPDHDVLASHPIVNTQVLHHLGHGDLIACTDVAHCDGSKVHFVDGRSETIDLIVMATGYRRRYPFLPAEVGNGEAEPLDLYLNVFHRERDDLAFVGLFETDGPSFALMGLQAELVARNWASKGAKRADEFARRRRTARPDLRGGHRYLSSQRHDYYVNSRSYTRLLELELHS
jgi:thioredoxin reductase